MKKILFFLLLSSVAFGQGAYNGAPKLNTAPQGDESGLLVRQIPQDIDRIGFNSAITGGVDADWGAVIGSIGSGMTVNQTASTLVITTGTTARSETIIRSNEAWIGGIRLRARSTLSQRIVNQNFFVELVDVIGDGLAYSIGSATAITVTIPSNPFTAANVGQSMYIGLFSGTGTFLSGKYPIASVSGNDVTFTVSGFAAGTGTCSLFGHSFYQLRYSSTTATNAEFDTQRSGYGSGFTNATINTTAAPGHLAIITGDDLQSIFSDRLAATNTGVAITQRASRDEFIPDDKNLRLQIRVLNLGTAPASTTTWTIGYVSVSHYASTDVAIQNIKPMSNSFGFPVDVVRTITQPVSNATASNLNAQVIGLAAHSAAASGNPLRIGGRVTETTPATQDQTRAAGDVSDFAMSSSGQALTKPFSTAEIDWHYVAATSGIVSTTTAVTVKAASGTAGIRNYITSIDVSAIGAGTASELVIRDGAAGTVIWRIQIPALGFNNPFTIEFPTPLRGTANTLLEVATLTSTATPVFLNVHGYTNN